jgi:SMEK domain-containing protein|tara:strand:+ start:21911 stop:22921 length:1011 start_codon:yes stop_codon:yes gene_type:complete
MLTRGILIGKIVDDIATLKYQIDLRNRLGQYDLSKFCEDFFKEALNSIYGYNLVNLNKTRSNYPGLDLGDDKKGIGVQVTSQNTKAKLEATYIAITDEQRKIFIDNYILIIGDKQGSYSVKKIFLKKHNFDLSKNILDLNTLLRDIVLLNIDQLEPLYSLFSKEFRQVKIELEPIDSKGNFESSYYNTVEKKPSTPPKNGHKFLGPEEKHYHKEFDKLLDLYDKLSAVPRVTREILSLVVDRGRFEPTWQISNKYAIIPQTLEKILRISQAELLTEINILEDASLVSIEEGDVGERIAHYLVIDPSMLNELFSWAKEEKQSIRTLLNTMDFSILDG